MFGVARDGLQGFCCGLEKDAIDYLLILVSDRGDLFRHRKDHMEIGDIQKLGLPVLDPLRPRQTLAFGAVSIATTNGELSITCVMGSNSLWGVEE